MFDLLGEEEIKTAFIPTASNVEEGRKDWLIEDYISFLNLGYIDIIDISALSREIYMKRLNEVNVIVMGGGDTTYLM